MPTDATAPVETPETLTETLRGAADTLLVECPGEVLSEARAETLRELADWLEAMDHDPEFSETRFLRWLMARQ